MFCLAIDLWNSTAGLFEKNFYKGEVILIDFSTDYSASGQTSSSWPSYGESPYVTGSGSWKFQFKGKFPVKVEGILEDGLIYVKGEKLYIVNDGVQRIYVEGEIAPEDVRFDVVSADKVVNLKITFESYTRTEE